MEIGKKIRAERKARGLTQDALSRLTEDVSLNVLNRIETGAVTNPHYETLVGIAEGLGMPVSELLEEEADLVGKAQARRDSGDVEEGLLSQSTGEFRRWAEALAEQDPQALIDAFDGLEAERDRLDERVKEAKHAAHAQLQHTVSERANRMSDEQLLALIEVVESVVEAQFAEELKRSKECFIHLLNIGERVAARLNAGPVLTGEDHAALLELGRHGVTLTRNG